MKEFLRQSDAELIYRKFWQGLNREVPAAKCRGKTGRQAEKKAISTGDSRLSTKP